MLHADAQVVNNILDLDALIVISQEVNTVT